MRIQERRQARKALDRRLRCVDTRPLTPPAVGWLRAVRDALGISTRQLGRMMGVSAPTIVDLEASERAGTAQLNTLRRAADAMGCDLVYAFVPRAGTLDDLVLLRATAVARRELDRVDATMRLEDQAVGAEQLSIAVSELADELRDDRSIWDSEPSAHRP